MLVKLTDIPNDNLGGSHHLLEQKLKDPNMFNNPIEADILSLLLVIEGRNNLIVFREYSTLYLS